VRIAEQVRFVVLGAQREGNRALAERLRPLGLTPSQAEVLRVVGDAAPIGLSALGELLVCESGTSPSRLVDRLVAVGLVERRTADHDRRAVVLALTAEGRRLEGEVRAIEETMYSDLAGLGSDEELRMLVEVLGRFIAGRPSGAALRARAAIA
jgi:DNA-binding MarR family transcriptional regulator